MTAFDWLFSAFLGLITLGTLAICGLWARDVIRFERETRDAP